jgi:hypothetical protein
MNIQTLTFDSEGNYLVLICTRNMTIEQAIAMWSVLGIFSPSFDYITF